MASASQLERPSALRWQLCDLCPYPGAKHVACSVPPSLCLSLQSRPALKTGPGAIEDHRGRCLSSISRRVKTRLPDLAGSSRGREASSPTPSAPVGQPGLVERPAGVRPARLELAPLGGDGLRYVQARGLRAAVAQRPTGGRTEVQRARRGTGEEYAPRAAAADGLTPRGDLCVVNGRAVAGAP